MPNFPKRANLKEKAVKAFKETGHFDEYQHCDLCETRVNCYTIVKQGTRKYRFCQQCYRELSEKGLIELVRKKEENE